MDNKERNKQKPDSNSKNSKQHIIVITNIEDLVNQTDRKNNEIKPIKRKKGTPDINLEKADVC